ncbi:MAG: glycerophosphodiester phosphodiesterase family protein, partial [Pseudomonadota bacterium]
MRRLAFFITLIALSACDQRHEANKIVSIDRVRFSQGIPADHLLAPISLPAFFDCLREKNQTVVEAHRGGPAPDFAENSIETFEHTLAQAPAFIELDVTMTKNGALVLMHDDTVDRTTDGRGAVADLTLAEFQRLRMRDDDGKVLPFTAPTFAEALAWSDGKTVLEVDIKKGASWAPVVAAIRAADAMNRVILITYSNDEAIEAHRAAPEAMISATIRDARDLDALQRGGVDLPHVLAWTGTHEPDSALNVALARRGVEAMFGTLGRPGESWDSRF